jgi:hypothetical protein
VLKPTDLFILIKLACIPAGSWTFASLGHELGLSSSAVHRGLEHAAMGSLYQPRRRAVASGALLELLLHGARFVYPAARSGEARGLPTAWAASPLSRALVSSEENPPIWPDAMGEVRGFAIEPLHPAVPDAARRDHRLWELLSLFDAIRIGGPRERGLAGEMLAKRIAEWASAS